MSQTLCHVTTRGSHFTVCPVEGGVAAAVASLSSAAEEDGPCEAKPPRVVFQHHSLDVSVHGHDESLVLV